MIIIIITIANGGDATIMKFETIGNYEKPKILLVHAMFAAAESFLPLVEYLKDKYYVIMPTLDGHSKDEKGDFLSLKNEADQIIAYLKKNNIDDLEIILGTSLGAIIAFEVYSRNEININKVFLDGAPLFKFSSFLQKIAEKKFWKICCMFRQKPEKTLEKIDKLFPGLGKLMLSVCTQMSEKSCKNLSRACFSFVMPELNEKQQKKIVFMYGTKEPARMCMGRLKRYKYSHILMRKGYKHCGYLLENPKEYADMLCN